MEIAHHAQLVLDYMAAAGFEAWVVGGCVRDTQMGRTPHDWDITTSAKPEEVRAALPYPVIGTGIDHGTVTAVIEGKTIEITTYRVEGAYSDARRPDWVAFTPSLQEDLARRDFTINAMAAQGELLCDPFGGQADLLAGIIRTVGDPFLRFGEDALRILRALRFAATLGFDIEGKTAAAICALKDNLKHIAAERIAAELIPLVTGSHAVRILREYAPVIAVFLPEILPAVGFDQCNHHHIWDVWEHTLRAMEVSPPDKEVRLCLLFHDLGKPQCFSVDTSGTGHFYGHNAVSADLCQRALRRLRFDRATIRNVEALVRYHDADLLPTPKSIRRWLGQLDAQRLTQLIEVKRADNLAQAPAYHGKQEALDRALQILSQVLAENAPFSLRHLAVNGRDMMSLGIQRKAIGTTLDTLLEDVIDGSCPNEREALMKRAMGLSRR